ncbi:phytanoyl-CoA dioxygenase family protein [Phycisphaera mikurensis]|uniref:Phytanoyl-CoA dioxygenase n=1 Tax=Phycisphaera mikurensis (strain NBRC 102666 / KCTC 22515 / FYK2301M01) TaxID=1142394 RepID=I0IC66_PHYMF|nr:phytanoyl-CoA dioxygenase family protein [Phycisphaera mikurensis]MBB6441927.1 hypothetical protein [Phycisphaera mikurensis]BAM02854.1 hypothetical protein PSMK_06950 [Phycisphaera mikurensis NBRC 102666]
MPATAAAPLVPPAASGTDRLTDEQVAFYHEHGWLRIPGVYAAAEVAAMRTDLDWMIDDWAELSGGWTGPWRQKIMDASTEAKSKLIVMHDLQYYSQAWMRAVTRADVGERMSQLLTGPDEPGGAPVELHHSTMHVKPPETGHPFPMHQDLAFYDHADARYVDALVHLDDTRHENGEIRFVSGSHKLGPLEHVTEHRNDAGETVPCTPHLPWERFSLDDTDPVPAKAGDLVVFNILTVHGSHVNRTNDMRRLVRVGYKHPLNRQTRGQSAQRPNLMVRGRRPRREGEFLFGTECVGDGSGIQQEP